MEMGRLTILQDGKKVGTEDFTITPRKGGYLVEGHTVMTEGGQTLDLKSAMELNEALLLTSYEYKSSASTITLKVGSPTSQLETVVHGQKSGDDVRFPAEGVILDSNFFHHFAILLYRSASYTNVLTVPAFVPQELQLAPITVRSVGPNSYEIDTGNVKVKATTDKDGRLLRLAVPDAKVVVERS